MPDPFFEKTNAGDAPPRLEPGMRLFRGRYELVKCIGAGGMGVVWLARDLELNGVERALKFLPGARAWDQSDLDRLKSEVLAADALSHPRLLATKGFEHDPPYAAIVMEYVDGATLKERLAREAKRFFEPAQIRPWILQVVEALAFLHRDASRMHRDVKPANVIVDKSGRAKLMDFGISEEIRHSVSRRSPAEEMPAVNSSHTLAYASPQQIRGEPSTEWDDVYGLGSLIFELLTGKPPFFRGDAAVIALQIETQKPASVAKRRHELAHEGVIDGVGQPVEDRWEKLVAACLAKKPESRPTLEEIDGVLRGGPLPDVMRGTGNRFSWKLVLATAASIAVGGWLLHAGLGGDAAEERVNFSPPPVTPKPVIEVKKLGTATPAPIPKPVPRAQFTKADVERFVRRYYEMCNEPGGWRGRASLLADSVVFFDEKEPLSPAAILLKDEAYQIKWPRQTWKVGAVTSAPSSGGRWQTSAPFEFTLEDDYLVLKGEHLGTMTLGTTPSGSLQVEAIDADELRPSDRKLKQEGFRKFVAAYLASCSKDAREPAPSPPPPKTWDFFAESVSPYFTETSPATGQKKLSRAEIQTLEEDGRSKATRREFALTPEAPCTATSVPAESGKESSLTYEVRYSVQFKIEYQDGRAPTTNSARPEYCRIKFFDGQPKIIAIDKR